MVQEKGESDIVCLKLKYVIVFLICFVDKWDQSGFYACQNNGCEGQYGDEIIDKNG